MSTTPQTNIGIPSALLEAAVAEVQSRAFHQGIVSLRYACRTLTARFPDCAVENRDLRELVTWLAIRRRANVAFD